MGNDVECRDKTSFSADLFYDSLTVEYDSSGSEKYDSLTVVEKNTTVLLS